MPRYRVAPITTCKQLFLVRKVWILIPPCGGSNPAPPPVIKRLILHILLSFQEAYFLANLRGLPVTCPKRFVAETVARAISAAAVLKISPAPFRGFFAGGAAESGADRAIAHGAKMERESLRNTEPAICSQRKPRSLRCSSQPAGSRGVRRINVWAMSCGGWLLTLALPERYHARSAWGFGSDAPGCGERAQ